MKKKLCIIAVILCLLGIAGKITYDKATEFLTLKGLNIISHTSVDGFFNGEVQPQESDNPQSQESAKPKPSPEPESEVNAPVSTPDGIDPADKAYVMGIYSRYSAAEVSEVSAIMSRKHTPEERARAKQIVFSKMSRAEYNRIMELARKYGY